MGRGRNSETLTLHFRGAQEAPTALHTTDRTDGSMVVVDPGPSTQSCGSQATSTSTSSSSRRRYRPLDISDSPHRAPPPPPPSSQDLEPHDIALPDESDHDHDRLSSREHEHEHEPNLRNRHKSLGRDHPARLRHQPRSKEQRLARGIVAREHLTRVGLLLVQQSGLRTTYPGVDWRHKLFTFSNCKRFSYNWVAVDPGGLSKVQKRAMEEYEQKGLGATRSGVPEVMLSLLMKGKVGLWYDGEMHAHREGSRWSREVEKVREGLRDVVSGLGKVHVDDEEEMNDA